VIAVCAVLSQVGATQRFEPLLAAMAAGLVIENFAVAQGDALKMALQRGALPVLVVFFVAVGTSLRLDALMTMGVVATGLVALRIGLIRLGLAVGLRVPDHEGVVIEDKTYSVTIHYRHARYKRRAIRAIVGAVRRLRGSRVMGGNQAVNIVPRGAPQLVATSAALHLSNPSD
jgi:hypothetical protein